MKKYISDILLLMGAACVITGIMMIFVPAGIITAGLFAIVAAIAWARTKGGD